MNMKPIALAAAAAIALAGCATDGSYDGTSRTWRQYDYNRPDPAYGSYDASRYHRPGNAPPLILSRFPLLPRACALTRGRRRLHCGMLHP